MNDFRAEALRQGFVEEPLTEVGSVPLFAYSKRPRPPRAHRPRIYLSCGVHGDEPAAPLALLQLLRDGVFDQRATWLLVPMLNPTGFTADRRENDEGIDLNRDYKSPQSVEVAAHVRWLERQPNFDLALCLHEDWEATGFYLYELNTTSTRGHARALRAAGLEKLPIDPAEVIDGRPIDEPGIIRPESDPALREQWPEAIYLRRHHTDLCYTIETPSARPMAARVDTHVAIARRAIDCTAS